MQGEWSSIGWLGPASTEATPGGQAADVWSCGVLLFIMLAGAYPFSRPQDEKLSSPQRMHVMLQRILKLDYHLPPHVMVSPEARNLLEGMLVADPDRRITIRRAPAAPAPLPATSMHIPLPMPGPCHLICHQSPPNPCGHTTSDTCRVEKQYL